MASIEINPSTELISDEFDGNNPKSVHIFSGVKDGETSTTLISSLLSCNIKKSELIQHGMKTKADVEAELKKLTESDYSDKSCLVVFFLGRANKQGTKGIILPDKDKDDQSIYIKDVWSKFILVESLRSKPKIFIFQAAANRPRLKSVSSDSVKEGDSKFDLPVEADLFIAFKNLQDGDDGKFIKSVAKQIAQSAERDDIIDIITSADNNYDLKIPTVISTLTRKFYFKTSNFRGNRWDVINKLKNLKLDVKQITNDLGREVKIKRARSEQSIPKSSLQNIAGSPNRKTSLVSPRPRLNSKTDKNPHIKWIN